MLRTWENTSNTQPWQYLRECTFPLHFCPVNPHLHGNFLACLSQDSPVHLPETRRVHRFLTQLREDVTHLHARRALGITTDNTLYPTLCDGTFTDHHSGMYTLMVPSARNRSLSRSELGTLPSEVAPTHANTSHLCLPFRAKFYFFELPINAEGSESQQRDSATVSSVRGQSSLSKLEWTLSTYCTSFDMEVPLLSVHTICSLQFARPLLLPTVHSFVPFLRASWCAYTSSQTPHHM